LNLWHFDEIFCSAKLRCSDLCFVHVLPRGMVVNPGSFTSV
jgi:hypothetical protein